MGAHSNTNHNRTPYLVQPRREMRLHSLPLELIQDLRVGIPKYGPVLFDIDICDFHIPVNMTESVIFDALVYTGLVSYAGPRMSREV